MKNSICITPHDEEMEMLATSVFLLNSFKRLGFHKREAFVAVVVSKKPEYDNRIGWNTLNNFWAIRVKNADLNRDIEIVLDQLKAE